MNQRKLTWTLWLIVAAVLASARPVQADFLNNGDAVGANYTIQNIDPGLTIDFTTHTPSSSNSNTIGEITLILSHSSLIWLGFDLFQNAPAPPDDYEASDGLRVLLDVRDTNGMIVPWIDYHIRARDYTPTFPLPPDDGAHRADAHFHNTPAGFGSNPLVLQGNGNNVFQLDYGLGSPVAPGDEFTANNILLHERDFSNRQRAFRVETIPSIVPEPTGFALTALGLVGLLAYGWERRLARGRN